MREGEVGIVQDEIAVKQQIEIERARATFCSTAYTSMLLFNIEQRLHERARGKLRAYATSGIDEIRLIRQTDRRTGVER